MTGRSQRGSGITLWRRIADTIRAELAEGRIASGGRLPSEAALAERFSVNRHTVRRALASLAEQGLVRSERGRGVFARPERLDYAIGPRTRFSEIIAAQQREPAGELLGASTMPADRWLADPLKLPLDTTLLRIEMLRMADGTPVGVGTAWFEAVRVPGLVDAVAACGSLTAALARAGIADYSRAWTRVIAEPADPADAARLDVAAGAGMLVTESLNVTPDGRPLHFARARFLAERVQLIVAS